MAPDLTPSRIRYLITAREPNTHYFEVAIQIQLPSSIPAMALHFHLPNWIPGSYRIRDFAKHVQPVQAIHNGHPLPIWKTSKNQWETAPVTGQVTLRYQVYAHDLSVRGAHLDNTHAYFNGSAVFLAWSDPLTPLPCQLEIQPITWPGLPGPVQVITSLSPIHVDHMGWGLYGAIDYADLIDHPVEIGHMAIWDFPSQGITHRVAVSNIPAHWKWEPNRLIQDLQQITASHLRFFGEPAPIKQYLFLLYTLSHGYGGLEHRHSTALHAAWSDLPTAQLSRLPEASDGYTKLLGLFSHEYFHTWLVKRIRPVAFDRQEWHQEAYTRDLWVYEGITSYYDDLALVRAGVISPDTYLRLMGQQWTRLYRTPGRLRQSLADSSFDAWIAFYQPDANSSNAHISYYNKGAILAWIVDWQLRIRTQHRISLDTVLRGLWEAHGRPDLPVPEGELIQRITAATGPGHQPFWQDFWKRYWEGTDDFEVSMLDPLWSQMGIQAHFRWSEGPDDLGGTPPTANTRPGWIGVTGTLLAEGYQVRTVRAGSPAEKAGIAPHDLLVAWGDQRITTPTWESRWIRPDHPDLTLTPTLITYFRRDRLYQQIVEPIPAPIDTVYFSWDQDAPEAVIQHRNAWLSGE